MSIGAVKELFFPYLGDSTPNLPLIIRAIVMMALVTIVTMILMLYLVILSLLPLPSLLLSFHRPSGSTIFSLVSSISPSQTFCIILIAIVSCFE